MVNYLLVDLPLHILLFQLALLLIIGGNIWVLNRTRRHTPPATFPMVSILVPARDEEKNIQRCLCSLLSQDYPNFELIVLDDQSSDSTPLILEKLGAEDPKLIIIKGNPLPDGWLGKNWACVQLSEQAHGDLLYFTDADTTHQPDALRKIVTAFLGEQADLMSGFPFQEMNTWGERLIVPFFAWAIYTFTPLGVAYQLKIPALSNAIGQIMLFRREAYQAIGGHTGVSYVITEDLQLAIQILKAGLRWRMVNAKDLVSCRMYPSSQQAVEGLSKNLFAAFGFRILPFVFVFVWLVILFLEPLIVLILFGLGRAPQADLGLLGSCIFLATIVWLLPYQQLGFPISLAFLFPATILINMLIAFRSLILTLTGRLSWKNRNLRRPKWKWI
jgi:chlorobactene glucosyltransferase